MFLISARTHGLNIVSGSISPGSVGKGTVPSSNSLQARQNFIVGFEDKKFGNVSKIIPKNKSKLQHEKASNC